MAHQAGQKIHVVHIIPTLAFGGAESFVVTLANSMSASAFRTTILVLSEHQPLAQRITKRGVKVVTLPKQGRISFGLFAKIKTTLEDLQPDIVHTHLFGGDFWGRMAAMQLQLPIITTEHNINIEESFTKRFIKTFLRQTSHYTTPSQAVADFAHKQYYITEKNITVTPFGIDTKQCTKLPPATPEVPLKILCLGRLEKQKGFDLAIRACAKLPTDNWQLTIMGAGSQKESLTRLIKKYNKQSQITIQEPTTDVVDAYAQHDVVLVPSRWEGLGLVVREAMAAGRIVIASNIHGIPESIRSQDVGILVPAKRVGPITSALQWVMDHPEDAAYMARSAQTYAKKAFRFADTVKQYELLYTTQVEEHTKKTQKKKRDSR